MKPFVIPYSERVFEYIAAGTNLSSSADVSIFAAARPTQVRGIVDLAFIDCVGLNERNWDGDGAEPVDQATIDSAKLLVQKLVEAGIALPDIAPSADGSIGMEWWKNEARVFVDVGPESITRIYFNSGNSNKYQEEPIEWAKGSETILKATLAQLQKLYPPNQTTKSLSQMMIYGSAQLPQVAIYTPSAGSVDSIMQGFPDSRFQKPGFPSTGLHYRDESDRRRDPSTILSQMANSMPSGVEMLVPA